MGNIIQTGVSKANVVIDTSHTIEDFGSNDCASLSLDAIGSVSSSIGSVLG